jgi:flagellar motor switch protein FliM
MSVELHDFRRPGRLASDVEKRLSTWLRDACKLAAERLTRNLPFPVAMELRGIEILQATAALARIPDAVVGYRVAVGKEAVATLLILQRPLVLAVVAGMVGDPTAALPEDRELTPVEGSLCEFLVEQLLLPAAQETWVGAEPLAINFGQRETNPKYTRVFAPSTSVAVASFVFRGPFGAQEWSWLLPQKLLLQLFVDDQEQVPEVSEAPADRAQVEHLVHSLPVPISVTLGSVDLPLAQLSQLRPGDLVILNQRVSEPLLASIAEEKKIRVWPGRIGSQRAVRIESSPED